MFRFAEESLSTHKGHGLASSIEHSRCNHLSGFVVVVIVVAVIIIWRCNHQHISHTVTSSNSTKFQ